MKPTLLLGYQKDEGKNGKTGLWDRSWPWLFLEFPALIPCKSSEKLGVEYHIQSMKYLYKVTIYNTQPKASCPE